MTEKFTDRIWPKLKAIWDSYLDHPFVKKMGDGSLDKDKFQHWLKQDYVYLVEYAKLFALGCAKAPNLSVMKDYAEGLYGVLFNEMDLHKSYAKSFGISEDELLETKPSAVNTAYTSYMLNVAQAGGCGKYSCSPSCMFLVI